MTRITPALRAAVASFAVLALAACDEGTPTSNLPAPPASGDAAAGDRPRSAPVGAASRPDGADGFAWSTDYGSRIELKDDECDYPPHTDSTDVTFTFWDVEYASVGVGSNGTLTFGDCYASPEPRLPAGSRALVAPLFGDLAPDDGGAVYANLVGEAPGRRLIVSWVDVPEYMPFQQRATFQVQIFEGSNRIQFGYRDLSTDGFVWNGSPMKVGISAGPESYIASAEGEEIPALEGTNICYTPSGTGGYSATANACPRPVEAVIGGPYAGAEGAAIAFDAGESTGADEDELSFAWDFGDGSSAAGSAPTHAYADDGTYAVTLVVDDGLAADTAETTVVIDNVAPSVGMSAADANGGTRTTLYSGESFTVAGAFDDPGLLDGPWSYTIDWGDTISTRGSSSDPSTAITETRTYLRPGTYTVRLAVTDKDGGTGVADVEITVAPLPVVMDIKPDDEENDVNIGTKNGVIPVAVLTTRTSAGDPVDFDAARIDATTVAFGPGGAPPAHVGGHQEDAAPYDGDFDMIFHFRANAAGLDCSDTEARLTGEMTSGVFFEATDALQANGCAPAGSASG